jgi:catechol 2,3-dioxygenase-like lactoylglutathione lyase family enzyme
MKPTIMPIGYVALVVRDYDEAIAFYTKTLDSISSKTHLSVEESAGSSLLRPILAKLVSFLPRRPRPEQQSRIGNQTGGRVFLFLHTDDFWRDYHEMKSRAVKFCRDPKEEPYGTVAVFEDLYGNKWDLLQLKKNELISIAQTPAGCIDTPELPPMV